MTTLFPSSRYALSFTLIAGLLAGCASSIPNESALREEASRAALTSQRTAVQALADVARDIEKAKHDGLMFYAPRHLKLAFDALETARKMQRDNEAERPQLEAVLTAETALKRAYSVRTNVHHYLAHSLTLLAELQQLETPIAQGALWQKQLVTLRDLIDDVENNKLQDVQKKQAAFIVTLQQVEIATHLHQQLTQARTQLAMAKTLDAEELAPQSWAKAQQVLANAEAEIRRAGRDFAKIDQQGFLAWQEAQHALAMSKDVNVAREQLNLGNTDGDIIEKLLLQQESVLAGQFSSLKLPTPRYLDWRAQQIELQKAITDVLSGKQPAISFPHHIHRAPDQFSQSTALQLPPDASTWTTRQLSRFSSTSNDSVITGDKVSPALAPTKDSPSAAKSQITAPVVTPTPATPTPVIPITEPADDTVQSQGIGTPPPIAQDISTEKKTRKTVEDEKKQ